MRRLLEWRIRVLRRRRRRLSGRLRVPLYRKVKGGKGSGSSFGRRGWTPEVRAGLRWGRVWLIDSRGSRFRLRASSSIAPLPFSLSLPRLLDSLALLLPLSIDLLQIIKGCVGDNFVGTGEIFGWKGKRATVEVGGWFEG
jgi:hypothetical protein